MERIPAITGDDASVFLKNNDNPPISAIHHYIFIEINSGYHSLWLSPKTKLKGGLNKRIRAFQPSRSLFAIMNKPSIDSQYFHLETMLRNREGLRSIYKSPEYDDDIKTWMKFGGDNEQFATLENVVWSKRLDKLMVGF